VGENARNRWIAPAPAQILNHQMWQTQGNQNALLYPVYRPACAGQGRTGDAALQRELLQFGNRGSLIAADANGLIPA